MAGPPQIKREEELQEDWLTTYADAITLLMCFFVIMYSISEPSSSRFQEVSTSLAAGFNRETGASSNTPFATILQQATAGTPTEGGQKSQVQPSQRGVVFDFKSNGMFRSGSAELLPEGIPQLDRVAQLVNLMGVTNYRVDVEGHTDDTPMSGQGPYPTNWELSAARATNVLKFLIGRGVDPLRMRAIGYAETQPKLPNRDAGGRPIAENQAENRRIVIRIER